MLEQPDYPYAKSDEYVNAEDADDKIYHYSSYIPAGLVATLDPILGYKENVNDDLKRLYCIHLKSDAEEVLAKSDNPPDFDDPDFESRRSVEMDKLYLKDKASNFSYFDTEEFKQLVNIVAYVSTKFVNPIPKAIRDYIDALERCESNVKVERLDEDSTEPSHFVLTRSFNYRKVTIGVQFYISKELYDRIGVLTRQISHFNLTEKDAIIARYLRLLYRQVKADNSVDSLETIVNLAKFEDRLNQALKLDVDNGYPLLDYDLLKESKE